MCAETIDGQRTTRCFVLGPIVQHFRYIEHFRKRWYRLSWQIVLYTRTHVECFKHKSTKEINRTREIADRTQQPRRNRRPPVWACGAHENNLLDRGVLPYVVSKYMAVNEPNGGGQQRPITSKLTRFSVHAQRESRTHDLPRKKYLSLEQYNIQRLFPTEDFQERHEQLSTCW